MRAFFLFTAMNKIYEQSTEEMWARDTSNEIKAHPRDATASHKTITSYAILKNK